MKKKKRKENKAKLNEDKLHELQEEEKQSIQDDDEVSENDDKICNGGDCSESLDGSEKSSCGSQVSPRKTDEEDETIPENKSPPCSPCHISNNTDCSNFSKSHSVAFDAATCSPTKCPPNDPLSFIEVSKVHKCNSIDVNTSEKSNCSNFFSNCNHSTCTDRDHIENKLKTVCKCDNENPLTKRNGYTHHQDYKENEHRLYSKRNGYSCRGNNSNIGPRFNKCDDLSRLKADSYNGNVYDKCYSFNNTAVNGRGRGKRKGLKVHYGEVYC